MGETPAPGVFHVNNSKDEKTLRQWKKKWEVIHCERKKHWKKKAQWIECLLGPG